MQTLPVDIDHLFVDVSYYFFTVVRGKKNSVTSGILFLHQNHRQYLNTVLLDGLAFCDVLVAI